MSDIIPMWKNITQLNIKKNKNILQANKMNG